MAANLYQTLGPSQFRILQLEPGRPGTPLKGVLLVRSLEDYNDIVYHALSYSWGLPSSEDTTIQLPDETAVVSVRTNLKYALHTLRRLDFSVFLWVDALCIDQNNDEDKNSQVPLIGRIYTCAHTTIVWLGAAYLNGHRAMDCIQRIGLKQLQMSELIWEGWLKETFVDADWNAVASLMSREYWARIWIVQELLRSKYSIVHCGTMCVPLKDFILLEQLRRHYSRSIDGLRRLPLYALANVLSAWDHTVFDADTGRWGLFGWMNMTNRFKFTVARDRFYALLGLSGQGARNSIEIQYDPARLSDELLNIQVTAHFLSQQRNLLPLQFQWRKRILLPSWCPDWYTRQDGLVPLVFNGVACDGTRRLQFRACGIRNTRIYHGIHHPNPPLKDKTVTSLRLRLRGWLFDTIEFVDSFTDFDPAAERTPEEQAAGQASRGRALYEKCLAWQKVVDQRISDNKPTSYGCGTLHRSALWRTLIADRDEDWRGPPPEDFGSGFDHFLNTKGNIDQRSLPFCSPAISRLARRSFIITENGFLGLAPGPECRVGDLVCVLEGGHVPFILRRDEMLGRANIAAHPNKVDQRIGWLMQRAGSTQKWVGEAFIYGIMQGEWMLELEEKKRKDVEMLAFDVK